MSGMSLASGARIVKPTDATDVPAFGSLAPVGTLRGRLSTALSLAQLQLIAFGIVLLFSGVVPVLDALFPILASIYLFVLARSVFPHKSYGDAPRVLEADKLSRIYSTLGSLLGLWLPAATILGGFTRGEPHAVKAAAPHLFLLISQTLTESLMHSLRLGSLPIRALTPLIYNARRLPTCWGWVQAAMKSFSNAADISRPLEDGVPMGSATGTSVGESAWLWFGRALAVANMVFWTMNILAFLIPVFLPRAIVKHYELEKHTDKDTGEPKKRS